MRNAGIMGETKNAPSALTLFTSLLMMVKKVIDNEKLWPMWRAKPFNKFHGHKIPAYCEDRNVDT